MGNPTSLLLPGVCWQTPRGASLIGRRVSAVVLPSSAPRGPSWWSVGTSLAGVFRRIGKNGFTNTWFGTIAVCTAFEVLGCSGRTVMTRGAGTTPAGDVPGAWPGSVVPVAVSSVSQQSRFSDFFGGRDSSGVLRAGGAEKTKAVGVPLTRASLSRLVGVRVVQSHTSSFRELVRARSTVRRKLW